MYIDIVSLLKNKGISKHKASQEMKISYDSFCNLYSGNPKSIRFTTLEALCKLFDCTPNDILKFGKPQDD